MSDLVERLRNKNWQWTVPGALREEAADEIERLQEWNHLRAVDIVALGQEVGELEANNERLQGALRYLAENADVAVATYCRSVLWRPRVHQEGENEPTRCASAQR